MNHIADFYKIMEPDDIIPHALILEYLMSFIDFLNKGSKKDRFKCRLISTHNKFRRQCCSENLKLVSDASMPGSSHVIETNDFSQLKNGIKCQNGIKHEMELC